MLSNYGDGNEEKRREKRDTDSSIWTKFNFEKEKSYWFKDNSKLKIANVNFNFPLFFVSFFYILILFPLRISWNNAK